MNHSVIDFKNKLILAPMVRISTLPMRLLALEYKADIVFCEEIIDYKMLQCRRVENELLGTTDFVWSDGTIVFRTCPLEKNKVIFQIGTADAQRAVKVAKMVENCVAGIDVNMGCPKEFSIKGGMGAALMNKPEQIKQILTSLVENISIPITCKTRIKNTLEETLELFKVIESTGVNAITIHGRTKEERPNDKNHNDVINQIAKSVTVPIIANGGSNEIKCFEDIETLKKETGVSSVMIARAAQWNPSIFSSNDGVSNIDEVIKKYLKYAIRYDACLANVKYCIQQFLHSELDTVRGRKLLNAASVREICIIWKIENYFDEMAIQFERKKLELVKNNVYHPFFLVEKLDSNTLLYTMLQKFNRKDFENSSSPKMTLYEWSVKNKMLTPIYDTIINEKDKTFKSTLSFQHNKFSSTLWDKSKRFSEQASALVCLTVLIHLFQHDNSLYQSTFSVIEPPQIPFTQRSLLERNIKKGKWIEELASLENEDPNHDFT